VTNNGGPARLLRNDTNSGHPWIQVRLEGVTDNRLGLGARVGFVRRDGTIVWRHARADGSYLSASDPRVHVGLGSAAPFDAVIVEWPRGPRERWTGVRPRHITILKQHTGTPSPQR
jgi:hypothetical protein